MLREKYQLDDELRSCIQKVNGMFLWTARDTVVSSFFWQFLTALNDHALDLSQQILLAYQDGERCKAEQGLRKGLQDMVRSVEIVEQARASEAFERFVPVRVCLGSYQLAFPNDDLQQISEALFATLSKQS